MVKNLNIYIKNVNIDEEGETSFFLVHHFKIDQNNPRYFNNDRECLFSNEKNKYSLLGYINEQFRVNDSFIFILEYPETPCYYYFAQGVNPITSTPDSNVNLAYNVSNCSSNLPFVGLNRNLNDAYLDGIITDYDRIYYWYFAIGQRGSWDNQHQIGAYHSSHNPYLTEVNLWMQFDNSSVLSLLHDHFTLQACVHVAFLRFISNSLFVAFFSN